MKQKILYIVLTICIATAVVVVLFLTSEHLMKKENPFVRRFLPNPISDVRGLELPYNSYYLAGLEKDSIYLGNYTAPLHGLIVSTKPEIVDTLKLNLQNFKRHHFGSIKWTIFNDSIFLNDSTSSLFYKGSIKAQELIQLKSADTLNYSLALPINQNSYVLRTFNRNKNNVGLGILNTSIYSFTKRDHIFEEANQPQDLFSNDGMLLYNEYLKKIIYVFYYKNSVLTFDIYLKNKHVLHTIDTISTPNFKVEYLAKQQQLKRNTNAIKVNKMAATSGNYLYIASDRIGKNERKKMYNEATIIDVYNLSNYTYSHSFYFYHYQNTPITQMHVYDNYIIGIGKNQLSIAKFKKSIYD